MDKIQQYIDKIPHNKQPSVCFSYRPPKREEFRKFWICDLSTLDGWDVASVMDFGRNDTCKWNTIKGFGDTIDEAFDDAVSKYEQPNDERPE